MPGVTQASALSKGGLLHLNILRTAHAYPTRSTLFRLPKLTKARSSQYLHGDTSTANLNMGMF